LTSSSRVFVCCTWAYGKAAIAEMGFTPAAEDETDEVGIPT
jgi:hypothetical protein